MGKVKSFFDATSKGLDAAAELWRSCCDASDAAAKHRMEQMKAQEAESLRQYCLQLESTQYVAFADVVRECVADNAIHCGLQVPKSPAQILAPPGSGVRYSSKSNCVGFAYYLNRDVRGGMRDGRLDPGFSTVPEMEIRKTLNSKISNFSCLHGFGPVGVPLVTATELPGIVRAVFVPLGREII